MVIIIDPRAIHDVPGRAKALQKFFGFPRSKIRKTVPTRTQGNPNKIPIWDNCALQPAKSDMAPVTNAPPPTPARNKYAAINQLHLVCAFMV